MENKINEIVQQFLDKSYIESLNQYGNRVILTIKNLAENPEINLMIEKSLLALDGVEKVSIIYTSDKKIQGLRPKTDMYQIKNVAKIIGVASGKGGVGKSTTAVNLALALQALGQNVAMFDADIYGPSLPTMLGYEGESLATTDGQSFEPFETYGVQSMSIGTLIDKNQPLIWRGSKACGAIEQLLTQTNWKNVDVMVIDMPPGTGDIQITLSQKINLDGMVIVSTPQDIALIDAIKGVNMFKKVDVPILGIVENMSYYIFFYFWHRADIFGHEGAKLTAEKMGETFLGEIPLHLSIRENADKGTPVVISMPDSPYAQAYIDIASKIKQKLNI